MERSDPRRGQRREESSQRDRSGRGYESSDEDRGQRDFGDDRSRDDRERYAESSGGSESWRNQPQDDERESRRYGGQGEGRGRGREEQRYGRGGGERSQFSPDWQQQGAEPRYSDEPYYARNREHGGWHSSEYSRGEGEWRGDENRRTTAEERGRGFTPREPMRGREYGDRSGGQERGGDERSDYGSARGREPARYRDDEEGSHYRGYYSRQERPFSYPGGSGQLSVESWSLSGPYAGRGPKGYRRSDQQITEEACQRLERDGHIDATEIDVSSEDGVIKLRGTVPERAMKRRAEECVESIYGARDVMNELRVSAPGEESSQGSRTAQQSQGTRKSQASQTSTASGESAGGGSTSSEQSADDKKSQKH